MRKQSLYNIMLALLLTIILTLHIKISHMREPYSGNGKPKQQYVPDPDKKYCNTIKDKVCDDLCAKNGFVGEDKETSAGTGKCKGKNDCLCDGYYVKSANKTTPAGAQPNYI